MAGAQRVATLLYVEAGKLCGTQCSPSSAGSSSNMARALWKIQQTLQTIQLVSAIQAARCSPWCDASSVSSALSVSGFFKDSLVEVCQSASSIFVVTSTTCRTSSQVQTGQAQLYQLEMPREAKNRQYLKCQVTQEVMLSGATVGAHLFPTSAKVDLLYAFCVCLSAHFCRPSWCH